MGDLQVGCSLPMANGGVVSREDDRMCGQTASVSVTDPLSIEAENLEIAEEAINEIVCRIQPTLIAHQKRKQIVDYVQGLIKHCLAYEVFPYGSVPLKTYLPDGDIDLTALSTPMVEDALVSDVHAVLKGEEFNEAAPYEVKEVHCIDAEVKLVKCLVQNIVVDISFNQLGGLCTLCFLEQVDCLVGKDHLFKRSIILIKAWCYYESRILGAHHGLISTYALETLVLYIFHQFHSSLTGPLAVLYRFLDYFSKFDWENYCVSLNGPVCKSSLPDIVANLPENGRDDLLLSEEFLRKCVDMFSVPSRGLETNLRAFPQKHLNIIDPLKENNNLGRSVNRGNFYRIRSAFKYGARKLGQVLLLPREKIADELNKFFSNTLERHRSNCWTDEQNLALSSGARGSDQSLSSSNSDTCSEDGMCLKSSPASYSNAVSGFCLTGNDKGFLTSEYLAMRSANDSSGGSSWDHNLGTSLSGNSHHAPQSSFSGLFRQNGKIENGNPFGKTSATSVADDKMSNSTYSCSNHESIVPNGSARSTPAASVSGSFEYLNPLLELSGDYDSHFWSVLYGQYCHLYAVSGTILPSPPMSPQLPNKNSRETVWQSQQSKRNGHSQMNTNGVLAPPFYPLNLTVLSSGVFGSEEKKKTRGTGTYFPNMHILSNRDRPSSGRGRFQAPGTHSQMQRHTCNNGLDEAPREMSLSEDGSHDLSHEEYPVLGNGKSRSSDFHRPHLSMWGSSNGNGFCCPSEKLESRSGGLQLRGALVAERSIQPDSGTSHYCGSVPSPLVPAVQSPKAVVESNQERDEEQSFKLKNEVDFPPLSL